MNELSLEEQQIQYLERNLDKIEQVICPVKHTFSPGLCIREVFLPKGIYAIGHKHHYENLNIIISGKVLMKNSNGEYEVLEGPLMYTATKGRKVSIVMEDTVWLNILPTDKTDIEEIEKEFLDKSAPYIIAEDEISHALTIESKKYKIKNQKLYATGNYSSGEIIANKKEIDYIRRSDTPNSKLKNGNVVAIKDIKGNLGGLPGDEITIKHTKVLQWSE